MKTREMIKTLKNNGFIVLKQGSKHTVWVNSLGYKITTGRAAPTLSCTVQEFKQHIKRAAKRAAKQVA